MLFWRQVQNFMTLEMEEPSAPVMEENQGAIKLANNPFSFKRTRNINI